MTRQRSQSDNKLNDMKRVDNLPTKEAPYQFQVLLRSLLGRFKGKALLKALIAEKRKEREW